VPISLPISHHGDIESFSTILGKMKDRLERSHFELQFPYFLDRNGGSGNLGLLDARLP
jgi:hypothetical protein